MAILGRGDVDVCKRIMMDKVGLMRRNRDLVDRLEIPGVKRREGREARKSYILHCLEWR